MIFWMQFNGLRLGKRRLGDLLQLHRRILEMRLLADGIPFKKRQFIGGAGTSGIVPVAKMKG